MAAALRTGLGLLALTVSGGLAAASAAFAWQAFFGRLEEPVGKSEAIVATSVRLPSLHRHEELAIAASDLLTKPLFSPLRQQPRPRVVAPPPPAAPAHRPPPPPLPDYVVGGVVIAASARKILLRPRGRPNGKWLKEGDITTEGWSVSTISRDGIVLTQADRTIRFTLSTGGGKGERFVALQ